MTSPPKDFRSALQQAETAATALGVAVRTALGPLLQDSGGARSCGRALGLERTLGWKVWSLAHASDLAAMLRVLPGRRGWTQVYASFRRRGMTAESAEAVRASAERLMAVVEDLRKEPALLRAIGAGGLDRASDRERMVAARRKASRANERLYGLHAGLAIVGAMLAPARRSGGVALACTAVFDRITRSRPGMPWPLYSRLATLDTRRGTRSLGTPIDPDSKPAPLVAELSSPNAKAGPLSAGERDGSAFLEIADVPPGGSAPIRVALAEFVETAARRVAGRPDPVHLRLGNYLPTDRLVFDVLVHRSMPQLTAPAPWLCGTPLSIRTLAGWHEEARLPLEGETEELPATDAGRGLGPAGIAHLELARRTAAALGTSLDEFTVHRVRIPFPPLFGSVFMSFELAPAAPEVRTRRRERRSS
jgi:hypothetical protein